MLLYLKTKIRRQHTQGTDMVELIKRSGILIPRTYEEMPFYKIIKDDLTRRVREYNNSSYKESTFYLESEKFLLIPRNYPIRRYISSFNLKNNQHKGEKIQIQHSIIPRNEAQKKAIQHMIINDSCILQLPPGVGKTVISIYVIGDLKIKSLILVHRDSLVDQWKDRFISFTNLKSEEIAKLSSTTFEKDFKQPIIISTTQTFLSLLNRKREEFLRTLDAANIGIFIGDEVHTTVGAPTFSECSIHIPSYRTYGLSATPYRLDGNGDIIEYHLGDVFTDSNIEGTMKARVSMFLLDYQIDIPKRFRYLYWGGDFQRSRYLNLMKKSESFMATAKGLLMKLKDDRNIIFMAERINLIDELFNWVPADSKSRFYRSATMKELDSKLTFTTSGKCRDGIDAPWKDCIVITSPIANIEQLTGRVIRDFKDKKQPIILDMVDYGCNRIASTALTRLKFYNKKNWDVQFFICKDGVTKEIEEDAAINIIRGVE